MLVRKIASLMNQSADNCIIKQPESFPKSSTCPHLVNKRTPNEPAMITVKVGSQVALFFIVLLVTKPHCCQREFRNQGFSLGCIVFHR